MSKEGTPISQEDTPRKFERIKQHVKENKERYLIGVSCLAAGYLLRRPGAPIINNILDPDILREVVEEVGAATVINNHNIGNLVNNTIENNLGRVSKIVRDKETGQEWQKMRYLAEEIAAKHGISYDSARTRVSQHLHGMSDHVFDKTYEVAGLRTDF